MKYYSVEYSGNDPLLLTKAAKNIFGQLVCGTCKYLRVYDRAIDVDVRSSHEASRLNFVRGIQTGIIRRDFAESIKAEAFFWLGNVYVEGQLIECLKTFRAKHYTAIRGDVTSTCWQCPTCKHTVYFPNGENRYILSSQVKPEIVSETTTGSLLFPEIMLPAGFNEKPDLQKEEILQREVPQDGQPAHLRVWSLE